MNSKWEDLDLGKTLQFSDWLKLISIKEYLTQSASFRPENSPEQTTTSRAINAAIRNILSERLRGFLNEFGSQLVNSTSLFTAIDGEKSTSAQWSLYCDCAEMTLAAVPQCRLGI